jgi:hypothetical protein
MPNAEIETMITRSLCCQKLCQWKVVMEDMAYWNEGDRAAMFLISRIVSETLLWERLLQDTSGRRS